ncbi:MAG: hypothetical protein WBN27_00520 [Eudoraea sp.]|uniref:hypothetical protein n=1 Tax=Eudoraea sp. TaxID=1979955 RepID=UPI003C77860C
MAKPDQENPITKVVGFFVFIACVIRHLSSEYTKTRQEKGLKNNTVLSLYGGTEHNLWLALDNVISIINMDSSSKTIILQKYFYGRRYPMFVSRPGLISKTKP